MISVLPTLHIAYAAYCIFSHIMPPALSGIAAARNMRGKRNTILPPQSDYDKFLIELQRREGAKLARQIAEQEAKRMEQEEHIRREHEITTLKHRYTRILTKMARYRALIFAYIKTIREKSDMYLLTYKDDNNDEQVKICATGQPIDMSDCDGNCDDDNMTNADNDNVHIQVSPINDANESRITVATTVPQNPLELRFTQVVDEISRQNAYQRDLQAIPSLVDARITAHRQKQGGNTNKQKVTSNCCIVA